MTTVSLIPNFMLVGSVGGSSQSFSIYDDGDSSIGIGTEDYSPQDNGGFGLL